MNAVFANTARTSAFDLVDTRRIEAKFRHLKMDTLWLCVHPDPVGGLQNFTPDLVAELQDMLKSLRAHAAPAAGLRETAQQPYIVIQSAHPDYFSMGGDLRFFRECIQQADWKRLRAYSLSCLGLLVDWSEKLRATRTSIALVQGRALGGGFEMALSCDHLIAEEQSSFGFPEIMFGLFPCTGAMPLLASRIGARQAERMMTNKKIYSAQELHAMGLIDEICAQGTGELAVERYVATHAPRLKARLKVQQSRARHTDVAPRELVQIVDDWVATAQELSADELRTLDMLIMMQDREATASRVRLAA